MVLSLNQTIARRVGPVFEKYVKRIHRDAVKFAPYKEGNLEESIKMRAKSFSRDWWKNVYEVYVLRSSKAGKYAYIIHNLRYVKWWKRGPGTVAKGRNAKEKFIDRAVDKWEDRMSDAVRQAIDQGAVEYAEALARRTEASLRG